MKEKTNKLANFIKFMTDLIDYLQEVEIRDQCREIENFLVKKNKSYGSSALRPVRIFSKSNAIEQIWVRLDDKLSRIKRGNMEVESLEDTIRDIAGYCILALIQLKKLDRSPDQENSMKSEPENT